MVLVSPCTAAKSERVIRRTGWATFARCSLLRSSASARAAFSVSITWSTSPAVATSVSPLIRTGLLGPASLTR